MTAAVRRFEVGDGDVQVALGCRERTVAKDFLHVAQVRLVLQKMRRAGVPPDMRRHALFDPGAACAPGNQAGQPIEREPAAFQRDEDALGRALISEERRTHAPHIRF